MAGKPLTRLAGKIMLKARKYGPEGCVIGGILLGGAALILVGVKTWKHKDVLEQDVKNIKDCRALVKSGEPTEEQKHEYNRSRMIFLKDTVKVYWLPATLSVGSVALIGGGSILFRREITALGTAYAALMESYRRDRKERYLPVTHEYNENGTEITVQNEPSRWAVWFNEGDFDEVNRIWLYRNPLWSKDPIINETKLRSLERAATDQLQAYGYLFLNDVLKMLGLPPSREGQIVGWTMSGDGYVSFGIWQTRERPYICPLNKPFIEGKSPNALLDFNVDGPILYKLERTFGAETAGKLVAR